MATFIITFFGIFGTITGSIIGGMVYPNPKGFSVEELAIMAFTLAGLIAGVIVGDVLIVQNFM